MFKFLVKFWKTQNFGCYKWGAKQIDISKLHRIYYNFGGKTLVLSNLYGH